MISHMASDQRSEGHRLVSRPSTPERAKDPCAVGYTLPRHEIVTWLDAAKSYVSQVPMLERAAGPLPEVIHRHASKPLSLYHGCATDVDLAAYCIFAEPL